MNGLSAQGDPCGVCACKVGRIALCRIQNIYQTSEYGIMELMSVVNIIILYLHII